MTLPVNPVPASRPRVTKWGTYYTATYTKWRKEAARYVEQAERKLEGKLIVIVEVFGKKPKTTKRSYPIGDVDNHAKGQLDLLTSHAEVWGDDDQVVGLWVTKQYAESPGKERSEITIYELKEQ